jgi:hypothetical protein
MEIKNNYLSVTRNDIRPMLEKGQQRSDTLIGVEPYELPIDVQSWPQIECKVLYKIGDEAEAHQLLLARVETVTMTNEEALQKILSQAHPRQVKVRPAKRKRKVESPVEPPAMPEAPLAATALPLSGRPVVASPNPSVTHLKVNSGGEKRAETAWHFKNVAGLSDDFFDFEQAFGRPVTYDASPSKWTWAKYQPPGDVEIYAGARQQTSKADIVVALVKSRKPIPENQLVELGKEFVGKYKTQPVGSPSRTVRYQRTGRVQVTNLAASSYHFNIYSTNDSPEDNRYYVVLSRLPASSDATLLEQAKRSSLLRFMLPILGDSGEQQ